MAGALYARAGLKILSVYMSGSKNMSYDSASLTTPDIKWLGVRPSDLDKLKVREGDAERGAVHPFNHAPAEATARAKISLHMQIPDQCRLPMTATDIKTGTELMKEEFIKSNPAWLKVRVRLKGDCSALMQVERLRATATSGHAQSLHPPLFPVAIHCRSLS